MEFDQLLSHIKIWQTELQMLHQALWGKDFVKAGPDGKRGRLIDQRVALRQQVQKFLRSLFKDDTLTADDLTEKLAKIQQMYDDQKALYIAAGQPDGTLPAEELPASANAPTSSPSTTAKRPQFDACAQVRSAWDAQRR
jgi:hypothetical protein